MARNLSHRCAQCRRAGEKLFLKGDRCSGTKCAMIKRNFPPGQHGPTKKHSKLSGYGKQLKEKQKVKRIYGIMEKQFSNYVTAASRKTGDTSKFLVSALEGRLDNVVYRLGLAKSRVLARQITLHGHIKVNGRKVNIPSFNVKIGDVVALSDKALTKKGFENLSEKLSKVEPPAWLALNAKEGSGKVLNAPALDNPNFNARVIIEFYSR